MKKRKTGIVKTLMRVFLAVNSLIFAALCIFSFRFTYVNRDFSGEYPTLTVNTLPLNIALFVLLIFMISIFMGHQTAFERINVRTFAITASAAAALLSVIWVNISGTGPQADQMTICDAASEFNSGYYGWLDKGQYLAVYPQNLGPVNILRCLYALFGDGNYRSFQIMSAVSVFLILYCTGLIAESLTGDKKITILTVMVTFLCVPMYLYTPFVYGDIPSVAFGLAAIACFIKFFEKDEYKYGILYVIALLAAITFRKNTLIIAIAFLVVCALKSLGGHSGKKIAAMVLLTVFCMTAPSVANKLIYKDHIAPDAKAMPALLWVQMGLNSSEGYYGSGWNDFSNLVLFAESDYDPDKASEMAKARLAVYRDWYMDNPGLFADFMKRKITTQWSAPMYQAFVMNSSIVREQHPVADKIYHDTGIWKILDKYMNLYQLLIYFGTVCAGIVFMRKEENTEKTVGLIAVFGGFVFSMMWEAKSRYVFPYLFLLIPYAVFGVCVVAKKLTSSVSSLKKRNA